MFKYKLDELEQSKLNLDLCLKINEFKVENKSVDGVVVTE